METFSESCDNLSLKKLPVSIFQCCVCRDIPFKRRIFQCRNGHIICEICNDKLYNIPNCPTCRVAVPDLIRNRALESALDFVETRCPYNKRGCSTVLPRHAVTTHTKECLFRPVHICKILGFSYCHFDALHLNDVVDHLTTVHHISCETENFLSLDFAYSCNSSQETKDLNVVKILQSQQHHCCCSTNTASTISTKKHQHSSFLFLLKHDENSDGILALCLCIGPSLQDSRNYRTAFYFTSTNVAKCVASWPVIWYKDPVVALSENDTCSVWDSAYHISKHTLKAIQGQDETISLLIRIRDADQESTPPQSVSQTFP